ncbi:hypothetical protein [Bordetella sp. 2513F-2]
MIPPLALAGGSQAALLISLACLSTLLTWLARLAVNRDARQWLRAHPRLGPALMALLAALGAVFPGQHIGPWLAAQREAREAEARRARLEAPLELAGIAMPAGTVLRLATPGEPATFLHAAFPHSVEVAGLQVREVWRHPRTGDGPEAWSLVLAGEQAVDGWQCARGHRVELRLQQGAARFEGCHLAAGNLLAGEVLPRGTWLARRDAAGWRLRTEGSEPVRIAGLPLLRADVLLDDARQVHTFEGLLAEDLALGPLSYPTGTRAASADGVPGARAGDLLFSPARGRSARREGGTDVGPGSSVLQAPDGTVRAVLANRAAGVFDVADLRIAP